MSVGAPTDPAVTVRPVAIDDEDLAATWCFDRAAPELPDLPPRDPRAVLEEEILRALQGSPCVIAFSGGCDSSCILALAIHLARREGLPEPVAMTARYPHAHPDENEDAWQELVIRELGVSKWERFDSSDDEVIGPAAERLCARHGVMWPPFFHTYEPFLARATGGVLLTGEFGDELSMPWEGAIVSDVLARRRRPSPRAMHGAASWAGPRSLRLALARRAQPDRDWLCEPLRSGVREAFAREQALLPWRSDVARRQAPRRRHAEVWTRNMRLTAGSDVELVHPFARQELFDWVARRFGSNGPATRAQVLEAWFGDCAPAPLLARQTQGGYDSVYWGEACREFAVSWRADWWPSHLVDPAALRRAWLSDGHRSGTWSLLQLAWWSARCQQGNPPRTLVDVARARPRADTAPGG